MTFDIAVMTACSFTLITPRGSGFFCYKPLLSLVGPPPQSQGQPLNHFIQGILKITLIEAQMALLLIDRVLADDRYPRARRNAFIVLATLMVFAWCNFAGMRGGGSIVHGWEQFHFYLGAKYQKEVGWFDLYKAALIADRESAQALGGLRTIRDIHTFELITVEEALADAPRVRAKFSDARWAEFKADWLLMLKR
jgi:hypothetical protein